MEKKEQREGYLQKRKHVPILGVKCPFTRNNNIASFGIKRFETWSDSGIGDIEAGFRYQYLKTEDWRLAFTGGVRFPTGNIDDPDSFVDYAFSNGVFGLLFRLNNDYTRIKNLVLNTTLKYTLLLPDKEVLRVPASVDLPITVSKEKVKRDLGDSFELEVSGSYAILEGFSVKLLYDYQFKLKNQVTGDQGLMYESLEQETDTTSHVYIISLSYSTIPLFKDKKFPLPLSASISYRNRFAGSNNVYKSQYVSFGLQVFF